MSMDFQSHQGKKRQLGSLCEPEFFLTPMEACKKDPGKGGQMVKCHLLTLTHLIMAMLVRFCILHGCKVEVEKHVFPNQSTVPKYMKRT